jgi:phage-related baseplate assembly protein
MARFNLPDVNFVDVDVEELESIGVEKFESLMNTSLSDADPRRKFIQSVAYLAALMVNNIDFTGKQNLLAYAVDDYLDQKGEDQNVQRLGPSQANTILKFEVSNPEAFTIPKGTRVAVNELNFVVDQDVVVQQGTPTVEVSATCEEAGTVGNGYLPNQITDLVDPVPWVSNVYNTVKSDGGKDWEDDDAYAERIRQSNESYSTAGPEEAYKFHAISTDQSIVDVQVLSPNPGTVNVVPLLANGGMPSDKLCQAILTKLNDRYVRPLTDQLTVSKPEIANYSIDLTYYLTSDKDGTQDQMEEIVQTVCNDYILWQKSKLGRSIDASELIMRLKEQGISRIVIHSEQFVPIDKNQVAWPDTVQLTYGGLIDE